MNASAASDQRLPGATAEYRDIQSAIAQTDPDSPRRALLLRDLARCRDERLALIEGRAAERPHLITPMNRRKIA
ncbi:hypothetical protein ACFSR9_11855 [Deinococcus taklimakanensis]|uniref:Uncharacterized protein n=1 Tax=Deinococcus taklimakanensis TaxID=536443 RepID=A0ABW5P5E9_9DEIO